tara:strand:+ start:7489 stop:8271 length:783 start_codon:yes stop_codon:yes gene_type:complete
MESITIANLIYQYYIPYESFDADIGGAEMPDWAKAGSRSAKAYADIVGAEYMLSHDRYFGHLDPRLDSLRIIHDPYFDKFDKILVLDLDMLISTRHNIFKVFSRDVGMVHESGIHQHPSVSKWLHKVMDPPLEDRGIKAYGRKLFGKHWRFPRSVTAPSDPYRYLNGGLQLWSKNGRIKARENFTSIDDYVLHTRYTEQMYINLQLSQPMFEVTELEPYWNRLPYQWQGKHDGKINHFLARTKFTMPELEHTELSVWQPI